MKNKTLIINAIIAAMYIAISLLIAPFGFGNIQFRVSEIFNHLVVFNRKYFFGIVIGVFIANLFSPFGVYDLIFGVGQSILALSITIFMKKYIKSTWNRMLFNTYIFTFTMFIIAIEITLLTDIPFWINWLTVAIGEFAIMMIGAPIMLALNRRLRFKKLI